MCWKVLVLTDLLCLQMGSIHDRKQAAAYREFQERSERAEKMKNMVVAMTLKKQIMVGHTRRLRTCLSAES